MKIFNLLLIFFALNLGLYAQKWVQIYGISNHNEHSRRLIEHYDKGYLITAQNGESGWLLKTDINGNLLWDKVLGVSPDGVITEKTLYDKQGNLYIFGLLLQDAEHEWPFVFKLDPCGNLIWCRKLFFEDHSFGYFIDAIILENGDLLGLANMPDPDQVDMIYLFRITPEGDYLWKKSFASKNDHPLFDNRYASRLKDFGDIYIISGYVYTPYPGGNPNHVYLRPMYVGIDTMFKEKWVIEYGIADSMLGKAHTSIDINDSIFMGVGRYRYGSHMKAWAMYYDDNGNQIKSEVLDNLQFGSEVDESTFYEIEHLNDSLFMATSGYFYGGNGDDAFGEIIFDTTGTVHNYTIREGTKGGSSTIVKTYDDKYAIACSYRYPNLTYDVYFYKINENLEQDTAYPGNYTYDSLCSFLPIQSGVIDLAGCDVITGFDEIPTLAAYNAYSIKAYPNPAKDFVTFEINKLPNDQVPELQVFDMHGHEVFRANFINQELTWDAQAFPDGIYFYRAELNGELVSGKIIINN
jgi:hypothetical protein